MLKSEGRNVEFKLELPQKDLGFLKTAVAFANCQGGSFVFGVRNEDHAVVGTDDDRLRCTTTDLKCFRLGSCP